MIKMERVGNSQSQKPKLNLKNMIGLKIFKENEEDIELYRIIGTKGDKVKVRNEADGSTSFNSVDDFEGFTPLAADGYFTVNIVSIYDKKTKQEDEDVIVTASKILNMQIGDTLPYAICRQSITDIFYNLLCENESQQIVGLAVNQDDCPTNFDFTIMLACNSIKYSEHCSFYRTDTLEDILSMINSKKFDMCLEKLYIGHIKSEKDINSSALMRKEYQGWCKDLKTLLSENTFKNDINEMLGITDVGFDMTDFIVQNELPNSELYDTVTPELKVWLSGTFRVAINDITVIEYDQDINLGDYNNSNYFFLRDINKKLWFCVYTISGQYLESDLEEQYNKLDVSDKYRLEFYNKYNKFNKK